MTTEHRYSLPALAAHRNVLDDRHKSGCPEKPEKIEVEVVRGPGTTVDIDSGRRDAEGRILTVSGSQPGPVFVLVRCLACGEDRLVPISDADEVAMREELGVG